MHGAALKHRSLAAKPASVSMMAATVGPAVDMASINGDDDLATHEKTLAMAMSLELSGGATGVVSQKGNFVGALASAWGALGVMYILASPIKRLLPIAVQVCTSIARVRNGHHRRASPLVLTPPQPRAALPLAIRLPG